MNGPSTFLVSLAFVCLLSCRSKNASDTDEHASAQNDSITIAQEVLGQGYAFKGNGKDKDSPKQTTVFLKDNEQRYIIEALNASKDALATNGQFLKRGREKTRKYPNLTIRHKDLRKTNDLLESLVDSSKVDLLEYFDLHRITGEDQRGNVHFTSYFIPVVKVKSVRDSTYKFPLYRKPDAWKGRLPSRKEIVSENKLMAKGLEIAYSSDLLENYMMQVQGSGYIEYANGQRVLLSYGGQNGYPYKSLGHLLVKAGKISRKDISLNRIKAYFKKHPEELEPTLNKNSSYVFFREGGAQPIGAANIPLISHQSIAVDRDFIPLGAVLLGKVPLVDVSGNLIDHEYRILFAHDVGGAINGPGHVDLFAGMGDEAMSAANAVHHYGKLWLLLPKQ